MLTFPRTVPAVEAGRALSEFSSEVVMGLGQPGQKELPSKYLYDEVGSALFEAICTLAVDQNGHAGHRRRRDDVAAVQAIKRCARR